MKSFSVVIILMLGLATSAFAQVSVGEKGEIDGTVFSDYYYVVQNHDQALEGENGFWFRRVYFTYNRTLDDQFSARLRLEMDSDGSFTDQGSKMTPVVKDAYLKWKKGDHQILAGISGTPTWGSVEGVWGYRSVEKSPLDLFGFGSSRDLGVSFKGSLTNSGKLKYHFMLGNGNSNRANETNTGKKVMLSLGYELTDQLFVEIYGDYDDREGNTDRNTLQAFASFSSDDFTIGALYALQSRENLTDDYQLASVFTRFAIKEEIGGFLRADYSFDGIAGTDDNDYLPIYGSAPATVIVGGLDFQLSDDVSLMPNIESVLYQENDAGFTPTSDIIPRLTLKYSL